MGAFTEFERALILERQRKGSPRRSSATASTPPVLDRLDRHAPRDRFQITDVRGRLQRARRRQPPQPPTGRPATPDYLDGCGHRGNATFGTACLCRARLCRLGDPSSTWSIDLSHQTCGSTSLSADRQQCGAAVAPSTLRDRRRRCVPGPGTARSRRRRAPLSCGDRWCTRRSSGWPPPLVPTCGEAMAAVLSDERGVPTRAATLTSPSCRCSTRS